MSPLASVAETATPTRDESRARSGWLLVQVADRIARLPRPLRSALPALATALAYYGAARFGQLLSLPDEYNVAVWPAGAVLLVAFLVTPQRWWWSLVPTVVAASLAADLPFGVALTPALTYAIADLAEAALAAALIVRLVGGLPRFDTLRGTITYLATAVVAAPAVVGVAFAVIQPLLADSTITLAVWRRWYLGDAVTHLAITPMILVGLTWWPRFGVRLSRRRAIELAFGATALAIASLLAFAGPALRWPALIAAPVPVFIWAAFRLGPRRTTAAIAGLVLLGISFSSRGVLALASMSLEQNVTNLQLFLLLVVGPLLIVSALVEEYRQAAESLKKRERDYREVVEHQADFIVRWRPDGTRVFVNTAYCRYFGSSREHLIGTSFLPLVSEDYREEVLAKVARLTPDHPTETDIHSVILPGGRTGWNEWVDLGVFDDSGRLVEIQSVGRDVTDRVAAEIALRDSEARYRSLFEKNLAGVYRSTLAGRLVDCNEAFARIFGCHSRDEMLHIPPVSFYDTPEDRESFLAELSRDGELRSRTARFRRLDGSEVWTLANIALVNDDAGEPSLIEGTMIDITERRTMEEQLRQAQKMEAVGRLAGGIAHDFNNILQAMLGTTHHARKDAGPETGARLSELEAHILRGSRLTRQLLLFSSHDAGMLGLVDLNEIVSGSLDLLKRLIPENIRIRALPAAGPLWLEADRGQIEQVVMNLTVNAADAMPRGGIVTLQTGSTDDAVWLDIEDNGHGIPEAMKARVFEPFFTTKGSERGTGLGLSVVQGIVLRHGGRIEFESTENTGSRFRVALPGNLTGVAATPKADARPQPESGRGERILLVEDDDAVRESVAEVLATLGYLVTTCLDVRSALDRPEDQLFDLLLTDYLLPDGRGTEIATAYALRQPELPCIVMSGYASGMAPDYPARTGIGFLQKPLTIDTLSRAIREALDGSSSSETASPGSP